MTDVVSTEPTLSPLETLGQAIVANSAGAITAFHVAFGELNLLGPSNRVVQALTYLRDHPDYRFHQLVDLCGMDLSSWKDQPWEGPRFVVVSHLLSVSKNWRVRLKVTCPDDDLPLVASLSDVWSGVGWPTDCG